IPTTASLRPARPPNWSKGHQGPNKWQNYPVLVSTVGGTAGGTTVTAPRRPQHPYTIEFYSNSAADAGGSLQGQFFLRELVVTSDALGNATFSPSFQDVTGGDRFITAVAIDPSGNTSEFAPQSPYLQLRGGSLVINGAESADNFLVRPSANKKSIEVLSF